jgi:hypothetical protein
LTAAEWRRVDAWADPAAWRAFLTQVTDPDPNVSTFEVESSLCAVGQFIIRSSDDERVADGLEALLDASNPKVRDIAVQIVLRDIMHSESRSAAMFEAAAKSALSTIGYAAQKKKVDRRQELSLPRRSSRTGSSRGRCRASSNPRTGPRMIGYFGLFRRQPIMTQSQQPAS